VVKKAIKQEKFMKINNVNLGDEISPEILVNVNGEIMYFNEKARIEFKLKIKKSISYLIDLDEIKKFSMFTSKADIISTFHDKYKYALIFSSGDALNKIIKIVFKENIGNSDELLKSERNILSTVNCVSLNKRISRISLDNVSQKIKKIIEGRGHYLNVYNKLQEDICVNESVIRAIIISGITMMNETSPNRPVDLYIKRDANNFIEIKIIVRVDTNETRYTAQGVERIFPWTAIRIALIDKICDDNGLSYNVTLVEKSLKLIYKIKEEKLAGLMIHSINIGEIDIEALFDMLAPRNNLIMDYDI
jgi:hypothetical protein